MRDEDVPKSPLTNRAYQVVRASIDNLPRPRQFCGLTPGALVIPEGALEDDTGPNSMYYALWWETHRVDLEVNGVIFACIIPKLTLGPDPRSTAPCRVDAMQAAVFRIAGRPRTEIYCTSGIATGGDELPGAYDEGGFEGLDFELIWKSDANPVT